MTCGVTVAVAVTAALAATGGWFADHWGWRSVFYVGGVAPILLAVVLIRVLPESTRFLAARGVSPERIARIMREECVHGVARRRVHDNQSLRIFASGFVRRAARRSFHA